MQKKTFPDFVPPMMAQSAKEAFDSPDWIFEIKLDGYRAITVFDAAGKPHLWSRKRLAAGAEVPGDFKGGFPAETAFDRSRRRDCCRGRERNSPVSIAAKIS